MLLKMGDNNSSVKELQSRLISEGYNCGASGADGDFGQGTYDAVIQFQQEVGLVADGIVGDYTWNALLSITGNGDPYLLKKGDKGETVKSLQSLLINKGYSCGTSGADGDFGQGTYDAVCAFQRDHGLTADGVVGKLTFSELRSTNNNSLLRIGSKGANVRELQSLLINKGYSCGTSGADGDFGQGTWNAVFEFQRDHGLTADGIVGPATWSVLRTGQANSTLSIGSRGCDVVLLQNILIRLGYSCGSYGSDGDFGQSTYNAVCAFQRDHGLTVDGIVGPATWAALNGNNIPANQLLQMGSKGEAVRELQRLLIALGYSCGASGADGDFGQGTYNAVCAFQRDHGLTADGIVGPATWAALNGNATSHVPASGSAGVARFLEVARGEVGYAEIPINYTKYGRWYGLDGNAWCAMFVSWCANEAGILGSVVPNYCLCSNGVATYKKCGRYRTRKSGYIPKEGDIFFLYDSKQNPPYCHTGIVEYVQGDVLHTIEGNSGDMVRRCTRRLSDSNIDGYGDNGGIYTFADSDEKIFEEQSKVGFASILGIKIKNCNEIAIPVYLPGVTIKYKFSMDHNVSSSDSSKINGVIKIKDGKITTNINTPYADVSKVTRIKELINSVELRANLLKLGDNCDINISIKILNDSCVDVILSQVNKLSNGIIATQSIEYIFKPYDDISCVYETIPSSSVDWSTVGKVAGYVGIAALVIVGVVVFGPELVGSLALLVALGA